MLAPDGEEVSDILYSRDGFIKYDAKIDGNKGIDGLFVKGNIENPSSIHIDEAKFRNNFEESGVTLNKPNDDTLLPSQSSKAWVINRANRMIDIGDKTNNEELVKLGQMLLDNESIIKKTVTVINPATGEINILKLDTDF